MKYFLVLLVFGILCQNILARGLENPVLYYLERGLVRLEARQFSERENLEHRMLQLETQLGTQQGEETLKPTIIAIKKEEQPSEDTTFLQRLEKVETNRKKELEEQLAKFSLKYDGLSERFSAIEKQVEERKNATLNQIMERLPEFPEEPESSEGKSDANTSDDPKEQPNYESEQEIDESLDPLEKFKKIGKKYYFIENSERKSWLDAVWKCKNLTAHLASLQNEEEWSALKEAFEPDHSYWVDINDINEELTYISETTGGIAHFLKWEPSVPTSDPGEEDCVELRADYSHKMNNIHCSKENYYICERYHKS